MSALSFTVGFEGDAIKASDIDKQDFVDKGRIFTLSILQYFMTSIF